MKTQFLILFSLLAQLPSVEASFFQGQLRYISGFEFSQRLTDIGIKFTNGTNCIELSYANENNFQNLGLNPAALGKPLFLNPTAGTIQILSECVTRNLHFSWYSEEELGSFISDESSKAIKAIRPTYQTKKNQISMRWIQVPSQEKYFLVAGLVEKILGTDEVIEDYGLIESAALFKQEILQQLELQGPELTVEKVIQQIVITLILRDEFLSY